jgi:hypothetical protein
MEEYEVILSSSQYDKEELEEYVFNNKIPKRFMNLGKLKLVSIEYEVNTRLFYLVYAEEENG